MSQILRERILRLLGQPKYQPLDKVELSKALEIHSSERRSIREVLHAMESDGLIARIRKDRYILPDTANLATGILQVHQNGSAHLLNEKKDQADIYISAANTGTAMRGDKVVVQLVHEGRRHRQEIGNKQEGRVIRILARANETVVGTFQTTAKGFSCVVPDDGRLQHDIYVRAGDAALPRTPRLGEKVVVKLDPWEDRFANPEGEIIEVLGPANAPGVDMLSVVRKYHLPTEFPADVLREAERIPETVAPEEIARREDLRGQMVVTIDPDDARDYDDAVHVEELRSGWRLGVHIADVSHYVWPGTALDHEARKRGNSTYLVDRVMPMLPERLSNGICSLKPNVDRLAFSAFIDFTPAGKIKSARFARTVIRSAARLSYRQALAMLNGESTMPPLPPAMKREEARGQATVTSGPPIPVDPVIAEQVRLVWRLASILRKERFAGGSLDLDFPEVKVWLDENGRAVRLEKMENDISHQLVEECMLAANEVVAREIKQRKIPSIYRIHEDPDPAKLAEYRQMAADYGIHVGNLQVRSEVQKLLQAIRGTFEEHALKIGFLKSLKRAVYDTNPLGHYGLAKVNYTHFTSPIRRYADLVVHRTLADLVAPPQIAGGADRMRRAQPESVSQLVDLAQHISETERNSADAERDSVQLKKMEYFLGQLRDRKPEVFSSVVIDVRSYGLLIELPAINVTGLIHVSDLPDDFYHFDSTRLTFTGRRTQRVFKVGEIISVTVSRVDPRKGQIDFVPTREQSKGQRPPAPRRPVTLRENQQCRPPGQERRRGNKGRPQGRPEKFPGNPASPGKRRTGEAQPPKPANKAPAGQDYFPGRRRKKGGRKFGAPSSPSANPPPQRGGRNKRHR